MSERAWVTVTARVTDRWGGVEEVHAGWVEDWVWADRGARDPWKRARRSAILAERTVDPTGWRVAFRAEVAS